jgi:hypothetical protein
MDEFVERRTATRPTLVYLLWLDYSVLDVYTNVADAFDDAERFVRESTGLWSAGRPGRWFGGRGRFMEIEEREVRSSAALQKLRTA